MDKNSFYAIGLMSGTSLDGLDIVYAYFLEKDDAWFYEILACKTVEYDKQLKQQLKDAHTLNGRELLMLHNSYGEFTGKEIAKFIEEEKIRNVDFIASHGHTVFHEPSRHFNFQLGNAYFILRETGIPVIADFRSRNIVFGGQGAPLVPIGDRLLFGNYGIRINLGGFSNYSLEDETGTTIAGDICPVNVVLNMLSSKYFGLEMDNDGIIGSRGKVIESMLEELDAIEYYNRENGDKSLSREWLETEFLPVLNKYDKFLPEDIIRTVYEHIANQIAKIVLRHNQKNTVLLTGGGAKNKFLTGLISNKLLNTEVKIPDDRLIDYKEALIFAFLGVLSFCNHFNCLSSYTKAAEDMICGVWYK